ncbi:MAG: MBL fold metallo-hydrolase [Candidatus Hydrogenedentes bacterium]|nr:MBL fold metallo-hydrolase [Candidatus Hydrogenedentota bacterium]
MLQDTKSGAVVQIDCHYVHPERAAAYLLASGGAAAFIDNNTEFAVPRLLQALEQQGLRPEQVAYLIITHVHLDHCGGTTELLQHCPNATVLAHPSAVRHLYDPARLVAGTIAVYGEHAFTALYRAVKPVPAGKVRAIADGERIDLGGRTLTFVHTRGHANHHMVIHDSETNGVFTGDTFGIAYPCLQYGSSPMLVSSSTPTEFDAKEAFISAGKIMAMAPERIYLSHYGIFTDPAKCAALLRESIAALESILEDGASGGMDGDALQTWCEDRVRADVFDTARRCGLRMTPDEVTLLNYDVVMNARGLAYAANRRRRTVGSGLSQ